MGGAPECGHMHIPRPLIWQVHASVHRGTRARGAEGRTGGGCGRLSSHALNRLQSTGKVTMNGIDDGNDDDDSNDGNGDNGDDQEEEEEKRRRKMM
eukprot:1158677-Pelagomonas_calceolata.AAC.6